MRVDGNQGSSPNYEPNSLGSNRTNTFLFNKDHRYEPYRITGLVARHRPNHPNDDFTQPGILFRNIMDDQGRQSTIKNVAEHMRPVPRDIQERAIKNFFKSDP
jgi:catalase